MKRPFLCFFLLLFSSFLSAQIIAFPYSQDFESFSTCSGNCLTSCGLTAFWNNDTNDNLDWTTWSGATGSLGTGPQTDHNPGTTSGKYLYIETSGSCNGNGFTGHLESPWFNFSTLTTPTVSFWYHLFGGDMGTLHFDVDTANGSGWILDYLPSRTDNVDLWQEQIAYLIPFAG